MPIFCQYFRVLLFTLVVIFRLKQILPYLLSVISEVFKVVYIHIITWRID